MKIADTKCRDEVQGAVRRNSYTALLWLTLDPGLSFELKRLTCDVCESTRPGRWVRYHKTYHAYMIGEEVGV